MKAPVLAAQLYTLRDQMKTPEEIRRSLEKVRRIGYTSVQVSGIGKIDDREFWEICESFGLTVCVTHTPLKEILESTEQVARRHLLWKCPVVGIGGGPGVSGGIGLDFYTGLAGTIGEAAEKLSVYGLKFAYHNHCAEFRKLENGLTGYEFLIRYTDPSLVEFIPDTYWIQAGGASPAGIIRRLKGRAEVVHFKDMAVNGENQSEMAEVGGGNMDWREILEACVRAGVKYIAVEEDDCPRDPFDCLESSYRYLNENFGLE